jgi:hypothetical protein
MLRRRADVAVYSPDGRLQLEVEVKSRRGATSDWAARLLRNMLFHEAAPAAPYFMLALPEKLYLWDLRQRPLTERMLPSEGAPAPDHEAEASPVFAPYLGPYPNGGNTPTADLGEDGLTFVVAAWLTDLLNSDLRELQEQEPSPALAGLIFDSGLYEAVRRGSVATEAVLT